MIACPLKAVGLLGAAGCLLIACIHQESFFPGFPPDGADSAPASRYARARIDVYEVRLTPNQAAGLDAAVLTARAKTLAEFEAALGELGTARRIGQLDQPVDLKTTYQLSIASTVPVVMQRQTPDGRSSDQVLYQDVGFNVEWAAQEKAHPSVEIVPELRLEVYGITTRGDQQLVGGKTPAGVSADLTSGLPVVLTTIAADGKTGEPIGYAARVQFDPDFAGRAAALPPEESQAKDYQTHVLVDVFQVALDSASQPIVSADSLKDAAKDAAELRDRLSKLGPTKLLFHGRQPVTLEKKTAISIGASCPIIQSRPRTTQTGQSGGSATYQSCGCVVELEGQWDSDDLTRGEAALRLTVSALDRSRKALLEDLTAPVFREFSLVTAGPVTTLNPMLLIATDSVSTDERPAAYVARIEFRRTLMPTMTANADADRSADRGLADADISVFEVALKPNQEGMLTYDSLAGHAESFDGLRDFLSGHGSVRLLSRFTQPIDLAKGDKLEQMSEKQLPQSSGRNKDGQWFTTYRQHKVGTKIEFSPPGDRSVQGTRDFTMKLDASDMRDSNVEIGADVFAPLFVSLDHQLTTSLDAGRPLVLLTVNGTGGDGMAYAQVVRMAFSKPGTEKKSRP